MNSRSRRKKQRAAKKEVKPITLDLYLTASTYELIQEALKLEWRKTEKMKSYFVDEPLPSGAPSFIDFLNNSVIKQEHENK